MPSKQIGLHNINYQKVFEETKAIGLHNKIIRHCKVKLLLHLHLVKLRKQSCCNLETSAFGVSIIQLQTNDFSTSKFEHCSFNGFLACGVFDLMP
jgi:hypothetical protein